MEKSVGDRRCLWELGAVAEELAGQGFDLLLTCLHSIDELNAFCLYLEEKYDVPVPLFREI